MSFLNSLLSSIGGDGQQTISPPPQAQQIPKAQVTKPNTDSEPKLVPSQLGGLFPSQKRKAEDSWPIPKAKALKDEQGQKQANGVSSGAGNIRPIISTSKSALAVPYRGTSRPSPTPISPGTPTADASKPTPKKGSYAEIMARGSANNKPSVGVIKHKPKETISAKKEILMRKKGLLPKRKVGNKDGPNGDTGRGRESSLPSSADSKGAARPGKKVPQPSYKGTAAPKPQPAYKGTMKPKSSIADTAPRKDPRNDRSRSGSTNLSRRGKDYESEVEEDEVDEGEEEIYSDVSDDMEAGFSDVEEEETAALKAAKKDDEKEMILEMELKKQKEERKNKLAALAAKAPKPRY
ncbi:MAG: hypothetical protein L6R39_000179 [Caloplaca ligustica]|nr:MAG: hypothetical protein L6R39_000179 [Caloplaca ligustica]